MVTVALAQFGRMVHRLRGLLEDRRHPSAGVGHAAAAGAPGDPRTGGSVRGDRRAPGPGRRPPVTAHRVPARSRSARRPASRRHLAVVEGTDLRWVDGSTQAYRVGRPGLCDPDAPPLFGKADGCMVVPAPLYHNGPIVWSCSAWLAGSHVVVLPRFDAEATLEAIDRYRADTVYLVPTMMKRIWRLPEEVRVSYDLSSLVCRVASGRALPALAEAGLDRLAGTGSDLRALRGNRSASGDDHHRDRMARPPRFSRHGRSRAPS